MWWRCHLDGFAPRSFAPHSIFSVMVTAKGVMASACLIVGCVNMCERKWKGGFWRSGAKPRALSIESLFIDRDCFLSLQKSGAAFAVRKATMVDVAHIPVYTFCATLSRSEIEPRGENDVGHSIENVQALQRRPRLRRVVGRRPCVLPAYGQRLGESSKAESDSAQWANGSPSIQGAVGPLGREDISVVSCPLGVAQDWANRAPSGQRRALCWPT